MKTETNLPEIGEHRYGVLIVARHNGENEISNPENYSTREELIIGYIGWLEYLHKEDFKGDLFPFKNIGGGRCEVLKDIMLEVKLMFENPSISKFAN